MNPNQYPNLRFKLDDGRIVKVDAFVWQPSYDETIKTNSGDHLRELVIERKRLMTESLFGNRNVKHIMPKYVDRHISDPPRIQNTSMTVWLSSAPMSEEAVYSELIVIFFMDYVEGSSLESMLKRELHDFNWEKYAADTTEETIELWKEVWLEKTVH